MEIGEGMIPLMSESLDVFLEEIPGLSLVRATEIIIDTIFGAQLVYKTPYLIWLVEMVEVKRQVDELFRLWFIIPNVSS